MEVIIHPTIRMIIVSNKYSVKVLKEKINMKNAHEKSINPEVFAITPSLNLFGSSMRVRCSSHLPLQN